MIPQTCHPYSLCVTVKAVLRGKSSSFSTYKKKKEQAIEQGLEQKIKHLTNLQSLNPSNLTDSVLKEAKERLNKKTQQHICYESAHTGLAFCAPVFGRSERSIETLTMHAQRIIESNSLN